MADKSFLLQSPQTVEATNQFLKDIASHLSGRADARNIEYTVKVTDKEITIDPGFEVYPNRYNKRHKQLVTSHVLLHHIKDEDKSKLANGEYVYKFSVNKKQRRWMRKK